MRKRLAGLLLGLSVTACGRSVTPPDCAGQWITTTVTVRNAAGDSVGVATVRQWVCR